MRGQDVPSDPAREIPCSGDPAQQAQGYALSRADYYLLVHPAKFFDLSACVVARQKKLAV